MALVCFISGIVGGMVGIAGGIILAPVFLAMDMNPTVVAGTNQYLALISSISVTTQFINMGILNFEYAAFLGGFIIIGSILGVT